MTDVQTQTIAYFNRYATPNNNYKLNLSDEQIASLSANACIVVVGSITCENVIFDIDTLRLFKSKLLAEKYIAELLSEDSLDTYVEVQLKEFEHG